MAAKNAARYRHDGEIVNVPSGSLPEHIHDVQVGRMNFLGTPNRDSVKYESIYGLNEASQLKSILRGTLRFTGFWDAIQAFANAGLLREDIITQATSAAELVSETAPKNDPSVAEVLDILKECGVAPDDSCPQHVSPLDALSALLTSALKFQRGERDMIVLTHRFDTKSNMLV